MAHPGERTRPQRPPPEAPLLVIEGRIARTDIEVLCERLRGLMHARDERMVICEMSRLATPDAVVVDALARLQLVARRFGRRVELREACEELLGLIELAGLTDVVPVELRVEPGRQAEQREPSRGIEEEADPGDPAL